MYVSLSISVLFLSIGTSRGLQSDHGYTHVIPNHNQWLFEDLHEPKQYNNTLIDPLQQDGFFHHHIYDTQSNYHSHLENDDEYDEDVMNERDSKFLSPFSVIRFSNSACTGGGDTGTCYTARECNALGGRNIGSCANGFGTCCYQQITCGGSTSQNCTYLISPNYPGSYNNAQTCTMRVTRSSDVCQLRMDFEDFDSTQPDGFGVCNNDQFTVDGETKFNWLCGTAPENWHFYLDVAGKANPTVFNFLTDATSFNRRFKIKITQVKCGSKVPCGCGQYYSQNSGEIQSFNYPNTYLAGVDYGICFRKEKGTCTTTLDPTGPSYVACPDLHRQPVGEDNASTGVGAIDVMNLFCQIPCAVPAFVSACTMPTATTVNNGPLVIHHMTNIDIVPNVDATTGNSGYSQSFTHNSC